MTNTMRLIEYLRIQSKLTQAQLAKQLQMHEQQYSNIRLGKCNLPDKYIPKISQIFNIPIETIIYEMTKDYVYKLRKKHLGEA